MKPLGDFTSLYVHFLDEKMEVQPGVPCQRTEQHVTTTIFELLIPPAGERPPELEKVAQCLLFYQLSVWAGTQGIIPAAAWVRPSTSKRRKPQHIFGFWSCWSQLFPGPGCGEVGSKAAPHPDALLESCHLFMDSFIQWV